MIETIFYYTQTFLLIVLAAAAVMKLVLFFLYKSKNDKMLFLFFYPLGNIVKTEKRNRLRLKKIQNTLSIAIVAILFLYLIVSLFNYPHR